MAMLRVCGHPGCGTLTLGELCLEHEPSPVQRDEPRMVRVASALASVSRMHRLSSDAGRRRFGA